MVLRRDHAEYPGGRVGLAVAARFPLHEDELDVILDHRVGLERLPQETRGPGHFVNGVGNLVPDDGCQVVEADFSAVLLKPMRSLKSLIDALLPPATIAPVIITPTIVTFSFRKIMLTASKSQYQQIATDRAKQITSLTCLSSRRLT